VSVNTTHIGQMVCTAPGVEVEYFGIQGTLIGIVGDVAAVETPLTKWITSGFGGRSAYTGKVRVDRVPASVIEPLADAIARKKAMPDDDSIPL
jgi:hypothetical protein